MDETETDIDIFLECLTAARKDHEAARRSLQGLSSLLSTAKAKEYFRSSGGLQYVHSLLFKDSLGSALAAVMCCLACAVENDVYSQKELTTRETFGFLHKTFTEKRTDTKRICSAIFLLLYLVSNNSAGQNLAKSTSCIADLMSLFRYCVEVCSRKPDLSTEVEMLKAIVPALSACVNNPQNETNQRFCSTLLPLQFRLISDDFSLGNHSLIVSILNLAGQTIAGNAFNQDRVRKFGGLDTLLKHLQRCVSEAQPSNSSLEQAESVVTVLSACVTCHDENCQYFLDKEGLRLLLSVLGQPDLTSSGIINVTSCLGHVLEHAGSEDASLSPEEYQLLVRLLTDTQDEEVMKAVKYVINLCQQKSGGLNTGDVRLEQAQILSKMKELSSKIGLLEEAERSFDDFPTGVSHLVKGDGDARVTVGLTKESCPPCMVIPQPHQERPLQASPPVTTPLPPPPPPPLSHTRMPQAAALDQELSADVTNNSQLQRAWVAYHYFRQFMSSLLHSGEDDDVASLHRNRGLHFHDGGDERSVKSVNDTRNFTKNVASAGGPTSGGREIFSSSNTFDPQDVTSLERNMQQDYSGFMMAYPPTQPFHRSYSDNKTQSSSYISAQRVHQSSEVVPHADVLPFTEAYPQTSVRRAPPDMLFPVTALGRVPPDMQFPVRNCLSGGTLPGAMNSACQGPQVSQPDSYEQLDYDGFQRNFTHQENFEVSPVMSSPRVMIPPPDTRTVDVLPSQDTCTVIMSEACRQVDADILRDDRSISANSQNFQRSMTLYPPAQKGLMSHLSDRANAINTERRFCDGTVEIDSRSTAAGPHLYCCTSTGRLGMNEKDNVSVSHSCSGVCQNKGSDSVLHSMTLADACTCQSHTVKNVHLCRSHTVEKADPCVCTSHCVAVTEAEKPSENAVPSTDVCLTSPVACTKTDGQRNAPDRLDNKNSDRKCVSSHCENCQNCPPPRTSVRGLDCGMFYGNNSPLSSDRCGSRQDSFQKPAASSEPKCTETSTPSKSGFSEDKIVTEEETVSEDKTACQATPSERSTFIKPSCTANSMHRKPERVETSTFKTPIMSAPPLRKRLRRTTLMSVSRSCASFRPAVNDPRQFKFTPRRDQNPVVTHQLSQKSAARSDSAGTNFCLPLQWQEKVDSHSSSKSGKNLEQTEDMCADIQEIDFDEIEVQLLSKNEQPSSERQKLYAQNQPSSSQKQQSSAHNKPQSVPEQPPCTAQEQPLPILEGPQSAAQTYHNSTHFQSAATQELPVSQRREPSSTQIPAPSPAPSEFDSMLWRAATAHRAITFCKRRAGLMQLSSRKESVKDSSESCDDESLSSDTSGCWSEVYSVLDDSPAGQAVIQRMNEHRETHCPGCRPGGDLNSRTFNIAIETSSDTCAAHRRIRQMEREFILAKVSRARLDKKLSYQCWKEEQSRKSQCEGLKGRDLEHQGCEEGQGQDEAKARVYDFQSSGSDSNTKRPVSPPRRDPTTRISKRKRRETTPRRKRIPYSYAEECYLVKGVQTLGKCWHQILSTYPFHPSRTNVDIMEKYKRMKKQGLTGPQMLRPAQKLHRHPLSMCEERRLRRGVATFGHNWAAILRAEKFAPGRTAEELRDRWRVLKKSSLSL